MARKQWYQVVLKDRDGFTITEREQHGLKDAKDTAKYLLGPEYPRLAEYTRQEGERVEIIDEAGDCVWDREVEIPVEG